MTAAPQMIQCWRSSAAAIGCQKLCQGNYRRGLLLMCHLINHMDVTPHRRSLCACRADLFVCFFVFLIGINRSNEMLIAFHSSPYSAPLQTGTPNRGFELNVDILYTDSDSYDFVQAPKCEFHINASSPGEESRALFTFCSRLERSFYGF
jgi:hypothetical protein